MSRISADVVVVGGGVIGSSVAFHLTRRGCRRVLVLERHGLLGFGSTGRASGGIRVQFSSPLSIGMSLYSVEFLQNFEEWTGVSAGYRPNGYLFLATTPEQEALLRRAVEIQQRAGATEVRLVSRREIAERVPCLYVEDVLAGSFCPLDGFIEPLSILEGFRREAVRNGAVYWLQSPALGLQIESGRVTGVKTGRGLVETGCVVNAAGAWAREVAGWAGLDLPVRPLRRHVAGTQPVPEIPDTTPMVIESGSTFHFRKDLGTGGLMLLWNDPQEPYGENLNFEMRWLEDTLKLAHRRLPSLAPLPVSPRRSWVGLYEMTPDHHPILGPVSGIEGFFLANGCSGHGVMHSPALGQLLAERILDGDYRLLNAQALSLERFERGELIHDEIGL